MSSIPANPYDAVPFPSQPLPLSHPDRLAAVGQLFGLDPMPANRCRVLELGSATGGNLLPMADRLAESQFVGVDYSRVQVEAAKRIATAAGLTNVELLHADIAELDESLGQFDYIICHGVFSWVPRGLQDKILELVQKLLTPRGIAYISYNTLPGWFPRRSLREVMIDHAPDGTPAARLTKAKALLEFFAGAAKRQGTAFAECLEGESQAILKNSDSYIYHEYFESDNRPLYFHEFVSRAGEYQLQYLAEAAVATVFAANFGAKVHDHLRNLSFDVISGEQHLDVLRHRGFRQTLVCHAERQLERKIVPERIERLRVYGRIARQDSALDLASAAAESFQSPRGLNFTVTLPLLKAALCYLNDQYPRSFSVEELQTGVHELLGTRPQNAEQSAGERRQLAGNLVEGIASGVLDVVSLPDDFTTTISERPRTTQLAPAELTYLTKVTNRRHERVELNEAAQYVLRQLDGTNDRETLLQGMSQAVDRGEISILLGGVPARGEAVGEVLRQALDQALRHLASSALLIA